MRTLKYSRQRESIMEFLRGRDDHPTADTVYMNIRRVYPNISLGTVYRNLSLLASLGEITRITCEDGADRFDAVTKPHYHVFCRRCGRVEDQGGGRGGRRPLPGEDRGALHLFFRGLCPVSGE